MHQKEITIIKMQAQYKLNFYIDIVRTVEPLARLLKESLLFIPYFINTRNELEYRCLHYKDSGEIYVVDVRNIIYRVIDLSFLWSDTPQEHEAWSKLHRKWIEMYEALPQATKLKYTQKITDIAKTKYNAVEQQ